MNYAYYPGCSLSESAKEYDISTRAALSRLGIGLQDIPDWTCCGASAVEAVDRKLMRALPARNLALAQKHLPGQDILAPCNACYLNLLKTQKALAADRKALHEVNALLEGEGLGVSTEGGRTRHLLDVLLNDVGVEAIRAAVGRPLSGIIVAPYYGCQALRPYPVFDDPERPTSMEPILTALGASVHPWRKGGHCCGASLMATHQDTALAAVAALLEAAREGQGLERGADVIATVCPLCQMNLDAYQRQAGGLRPGAGPITVAYLPQLMGLAFGLDRNLTALDLNLVVTREFKSRLAQTGTPCTPVTPVA